mmetsp:Transcript_46927/g.130365  ORF Transcript_46927/g.130365 Transcript_46927/m.130365 type:complete len:256 (-) Transcript_46927:326-1093(-)
MAVEMASQATAPADHRSRWGGQDWIQLAHHRGCCGAHRGFVRRRWHGCSPVVRAEFPVCGDRPGCLRRGVGGTVSNRGGTPISPHRRHRTGVRVRNRRCATRTFACCRCVLAAGRPGDFDRIGPWAPVNDAARRRAVAARYSHDAGRAGHALAPRCAPSYALLHVGKWGTRAATSAWCPLETSGAKGGSPEAATLLYDRKLWGLQSAIRPDSDEGGDSAAAAMTTVTEEHVQRGQQACAAAGSKRRMLPAALAPR